MVQKYHAAVLVFSLLVLVLKLSNAICDVLLMSCPRHCYPAQTWKVGTLLPHYYTDKPIQH